MKVIYRLLYPIWFARYHNKAFTREHYILSFVWMLQSSFVNTFLNREKGEGIKEAWLFKF